MQAEARADLRVACLKGGGVIVDEGAPPASSVRLAAVCCESKSGGGGGAEGTDLRAGRIGLQTEGWLSKKGKQEELAGVRGCTLGHCCPDGSDTTRHLRQSEGLRQPRLATVRVKKKQQVGGSCWALASGYGRQRLPSPRSEHCRPAQQSFVLRQAKPCIWHLPDGACGGDRGWREGRDGLQDGG